MFNERGERSRVHPDDLRFLLLLVKPGGNANDSDTSWTKPASKSF